MVKLPLAVLINFKVILADKNIKTFQAKKLKIHLSYGMKLYFSGNLTDYMNKIILFFLLFLLPLSLFSQVDEKDRVPKQLTAEMGFRYVFSNSFENQVDRGYTLLIDYAWQLSGFKRKKASYLSVPLGYTILLPASAEDNRVSILSYGWTVRHELARDRKWIPFIGYGLLLNQWRESGVDGSIFGHQTRFDAGMNFHTGSRLSYFAKIEYSFTRYPELKKAKSNKIHVAEFKVGLRF